MVATCVLTAFIETGLSKALSPDDVFANSKESYECEIILREYFSSCLRILPDDVVLLRDSPFRIPSEREVEAEV